MTRIIYHPNENANFTFESNLPVRKLIQAVNAGNWRPPSNVRPDRPASSLHAVKLGRNTVLVYPTLEYEPDFSNSKDAHPWGERQIAVLQSIADGMTVSEVATHMKISRRGVYLHLAAIRRRLSAESTSEAIRRATELGLCQPQLPDPTK